MALRIGHFLRYTKNGRIFLLPPKKWPPKKFSISTVVPQQQQENRKISPAQLEPAEPEPSSTTTTTISEKNQQSDSVREIRKLTEEWTPIYRFNKIVPVMILSRLKLYQTMATGLAAPILFVLLKAGVIEDVFLVQMICGMSTFAALVLIAMASYTARLIGVISLNRDGRTVRIGHLTFWGWRRDVFVHNYEQLVPLSELAYSPNDFFVTLKSYDDPEFQLYLPAKDFTILEPEIFETVFGQSYI